MTGPSDDGLCSNNFLVIQQMLMHEKTCVLKADLVIVKFKYLTFDPAQGTRVKCLTLLC